jgi:2-dehydropantoate 2-reductase
VRFVVVGAGAIGGTVGARLVRDGHDVLFCDADADHVAAMNAGGLAIEGPVEELSVPARAVLPGDLPAELGAVLLAVKSQHTAAALAEVAPRLAPAGYVVSLQNGLNEPAIAEAVGAERTVGAFVNFGADYLGPGRIFLGGRGTFVIGELDGRRSERVAELVAAIEDARESDNVFGYLWGKMAYGAMLFGTAVSDLSIADALAEPRYRPLFVRLAEEVLEVATARPEAFDGFDPADLEGSLDRLVEFNRRSAKTHSGIYRDLAVRKRKTEAEAMLGPIDRPLVRRTAELIREIEEGRRVCELANLELLAAYARCEEWAPRLNAVTAIVGAPERAAAGPLHGVPVAVKDNMDVAGYVTTNSSTVGTPPPATRDAEVVARLRAAGADVFCKANLLEYAAGSVNPAFGMTYNPLDLGRTSGGSSSGSAALVAAGVCDYALGSDTGGSIRIPAAYCGIVGLKPTFGLVPVDGVFPLSPSLDHVGPITRTVEQAATLLGVLAGRDYELHPVRDARVGVLRRHLDDPELRPLVRDRVREAADTLAALGFPLVDVDVPELDLADGALGSIILKEAFDVHRRWLETTANGYGAGTRALLELGSAIGDDEYRQALADKERVGQGFARALEQVDVLLGPAVAYVAPPEDPPFGTPDGDVEARYAGPYNLAGIPAVSIPCGLAEDGLPAGLQLAAGPHREAFLLSVARAYERARG